MKHLSIIILTIFCLFSCKNKKNETVVVIQNNQSKHQNIIDYINNKSVTEFYKFDEDYFINNTLEGICNDTTNTIGIFSIIYYDNEKDITQLYKEKTPVKQQQKLFDSYKKVAFFIDKKYLEKLPHHHEEGMAVGTIYDPINPYIAQMFIWQDDDWIFNKDIKITDYKDYVRLISYLRPINLSKRKKEYELKDIVVIEELRGYYNNDNIEDLIWVLDISTDNSMGGRAKKEYRLQVFLGAKIKNKYNFLFTSDLIIPCNYCENWKNDSEYSYYNLKFENQIFSFFTKSTLDKIGTSNKFTFKYKDDKMLLNNIEKETVHYSENDRVEKETITNLKQVSLECFNVYDEW